MNQKILRETDETAKALARKLIREAPFAALAVNEPETGFPLASRVLLATDIDGTPSILVSRLSFHTHAMEQDAKVSLLTGEPGKGDPLAHPRLTTRCEVRPVNRDSGHYMRLRARFLERHPKAKTYIDFPDFNLLRLEPVSANLNGGFGKAYVLEGKDIVKPGALLRYDWFDVHDAKKHITISVRQIRKDNHTFLSADPEGAYLKTKEKIIWVEFDKSAQNYSELDYFIMKIFERIP